MLSDISDHCAKKVRYRLRGDSTTLVAKQFVRSFPEMETNKTSRSDKQVLGWNGDVEKYLN